MHGATSAVGLCVKTLGYSKQVIDRIRHEERTKILADVLAEAEVTPLLTPVEASKAGVKRSKENGLTM